MQLKDIKFGELLKGRLKKVILDMTSVKFESIVYVAYGVWEGRITDWAGLAYMAAALGMKEYVDLKEKHTEHKEHLVLTGGQYSKEGGD